jgi:hypothetical protein
MSTAAIRDELLELSDYAWQRLVDRLAGLTDAEYLWEPVPGCWSVRPGSGGGVWQLDFVRPEPVLQPVTTIAWRVAHLTTDNRFGPWLGLPDRESEGSPVIPTTAEEAQVAVTRLMAERHEDLLAVTDEDLWQPIGPVGGPFAESTKVAWVLHILDEVIHHGAEIALMRDLYRAGYSA